MDSGIFRGIVRKTGPGLAMQEVLYGFIMALIYVTSARVGILPYKDALNLVILIIGMNATWGAIDAVVFYMVDVFNQRKFIRLIGSDEDRGRRVEAMMDEFSGTPLDILDPECERCICERILDMRIEDAAELRKDRRDMRDSAVVCFVITMLTTLPIVTPILLMHDIEEALFLSSALSAVAMFFIGFRMERYMGVNRWLAGLFLTAVGWGITLVATFTGG